MQWGPGTKFQGWTNLINIEYNLFTITYYKCYSHGIKCLDFSDVLLSIEGQKKMHQFTDRGCRILGLH